MKNKGEANRTNAGTTLGKRIIIILWGLLLLLIIPTAAELLLFVKWDLMGKQQRVEKPHYDQLIKDYNPVTVQHINPQYLFFFPFDLNERRKTNNEICTVTDDGFRGPGPEQAGQRKLAFLLGGSSAFGYFASSDSTAITGYLNEIQQEYFFINAGVPSWNSTQELFRVAYQILQYKPPLVIAYDGANDIGIMADYHRKGLTYPAGTPESFDRLYALVGDIRARKLNPPPSKPWYERLFPRVTVSVRSRLVTTNPQLQQVDPISDGLVVSHASKYIDNLAAIDTLVEAQGGRFIGVFQPMTSLHNNVPEGSKNLESREYHRRFHRLVVDHELPFEYLDFSNIFDSQYQTIPCFEERGDSDISDETVFVDSVHLFDRGNRFIAEAIIGYLQGNRRYAKSRVLPPGGP